MPPITLTKAQFKQKRPQGNYQGYLGYIARHRAAKLSQANQDPLGQTSPGDINSQVNRYSSMYGAPMSNDQIQSSAQGQLDPLIAAVTKRITDQASTASGAISANSQALAKSLGGIDYGAPYAQAKTEQAAVDAALQQSLGGAGGTQLAGDLESRLAQIQDPAVAAAGGDLASRGAAIGGTQVAQGSSNLGSLIASAAAAKEYGAKMPGIAQLSGLQDIAGVNKQAVTDIGDQTARILEQLPGVVQGLRNENQNTRSNRAQAAAQLYETLTGQNLTKATAKAGLQGDQASLAYQYANANADAAASAANTTERTRHDKAQEATAAKRAAAAATKATKGKTFTPAQLQKFKGDALDIAETAKSGAPAVTDAKGNVKEAALPPISREQAILEMERHGIPKQIAVQTANRVYGKPLTAAQKKAQKKTNDALFTGPNAMLPH